MVHFLHSDKMVGGVCGYMSLKIEDVDKNQIGKVDWLSNIALKFVDIQRTQQLEYHFSHLIDKGFEASFNFIHVLPGAFSAYNMSVLNQLDKDRNTIFK
jgi:chitin synthase